MAKTGNRPSVPPTTDTRRSRAEPFLKPLRRLRQAIDLVYREMLKFGVVGAVAFVIDVGGFNLLTTSLWPVGSPPLDGHEKIAKVISAGVAVLVAWLGNRYWSFRHRRQASKPRELFLFVVMNLIGILISVLCLSISHDLLGFTSALADNISGNFLGIGLGTLFRFWAYRQFVFTDLTVPEPTGSGREQPPSEPT
jgi:putative flippase GtrA